MGYDFHHNATKKDIVAFLKARKSDNGKVIEGTVTGNYLWMLVEVDGVKSIELAILTKAGSDFGYKLIGEGAGPYHYGCPAKLVAKADPASSEYAAEWRKKNAAALERDARAAERKVGDVVRYGKFEYRLVRPLNRGAFVVSRVSDGLEFSMCAAKFKDAEFL